MKIVTSLDPMLQTFWILAIISTIFYLLTLIAKYSKSKPIHYFQSYFLPVEKIGKQEDNGILTLNSLFMFILFLGWAGVLFSTFITSRLWLLLIALAIGFCAFFFVKKKNTRKRHF